MTRGKLKLADFPNDFVRKATFKKRRKGIMKKAHELSVLCGVDVCAIIYSPYSTEPDIWPPSPLSLQRILTKYNEIPEFDQTKKKSNLEGHLKQRLVKSPGQYNKQIRDNRGKEATLMMYNILDGHGLTNMNTGDIHDLIWIIDRNLKDVYIKLQMLGNEGSSSSAEPGGVTALVEQSLLRKLDWN